ncbi:MAG: type III-B CRISPR module RAMP protein Cmr6 [Acidobacteria bacterium]|nr:MAG: type III-B CRISPR module RAMP protein Cmr6 [Acidobacteriota bacterium]
MPIAAVPAYLARDPEFYLSAPPGHRFLLYFAAWGENQETGIVDWRMKDRIPKIDKKTKLQKIGPSGPEWEDLPNDQFACTVVACKTPPYDEEKRRLRRPQADPGLNAWRPLLDALAARQKALSDLHAAAGQIMEIHAQATAPFTTGLGNEHPLENGVAFLNPYGLPYLPGSGVKGVLRQAAQELASGEWGESLGWSEEKRYTLQIGKETVQISMLDVLFGLQSGDGDSEHVRGVLSFWDVIPQNAGDSLMVEIMTPHQTHYYQNGKSPHESGDPTPICFLTVPPGSRFTFHVTCDPGRLNKIAPDLVKQKIWQELLRPVFEHAFAWLGFGAKTAVGYGAMQRDLKAENERRARMQKLEESKARERELQTATAGLPEDAAWVVAKTLGNAWPDNGVFLNDVEAHLAGCEALSPEGYAKFTEEMEQRWPGIMANPDALEGKKQKPKFKDRPKAVVKRLLELRPPRHKPGVE